MNILYYDKNISYEDLNDLWDYIKDKCEDDTLLFLPNSVQLLTNASAEELFNIADKIVVALEKIKQERPEEYKKAYDNRMIVVRDQQWKEVINRANKNKKKKSICDDCTAKSGCNDEERGHKEKCVWHSTNPGGI